MKVYDDKHIKNIALVGAHHSGKTTLAETMLFEAGIINRLGSTKNKSTVSDFHEIEHERGASVFSTSMHTEWRNYKINIIDTPGLDDFIGEIASAVRVADTIVTVIDAKHGVEVGTEIIWNYVNRFNKPTLFVINQIDHPSASFEDALQSIVEHFGNSPCQVQYPIEHDGAQCIIDVLKMKMYKFGPEGGKPEKLAIPDSEKEKADKLHNELVERAAENDEDLLELYFEKDTLSEDEMQVGIKKGMLNHSLFPVFCVSALRDMGSGRLMGFIDNVAPSARELKMEQSAEGHDVICSPDEDPVLFIFKSMFEPNFGRITFFKVKSGSINTGDRLINTRAGEEEAINQLFIMDGTKKTHINKLSCGDIGATVKLKHTQTNDTLCSAKKRVTIKPIEFPSPRMYKTLEAENPNDDEKINEVVRKLHEQDPTIQVSFDSETKETILGCQGELHLKVLDWTLQHEFGLKAKYGQPKIPYRETIQRPANGFYRHKKQSGGSGQFAEVHLKIEPFYEGMREPEGFNIRGVEVEDLPWGGKLVFYNCIVGGVIDQKYLSSIKKGILSEMEAGPLNGSFVRDIRVMVYDGKMHPVDSNDISFKIAGGAAFRAAFKDAKPHILEPIVELNVKLPDGLLGDAVTDLQARHAQILDVQNLGSYQKVVAKVPQAELYGYSTTLRSITHGKGTFSSKLIEYAPRKL